MTSVEKFVRQLHTLHNAGIQVCAGAVGNPLAKNILADLRNTLSPDIYLFINAMQGLKSPLSNEDIRFFTQLDIFSSMICETLRLNGRIAQAEEVLASLTGKGISLPVLEVR